MMSPGVRCLAQSHHHEAAERAARHSPSTGNQTGIVAAPLEATRREEPVHAMKRLRGLPTILDDPGQYLRAREGECELGNDRETVSGTDFRQAQRPAAPRRRRRRDRAPSPVLCRSEHTLTGFRPRKVTGNARRTCVRCAPGSSLPGDRAARSSLNQLVKLMLGLTDEWVCAPLTPNWNTFNVFCYGWHT
jgi:hypothetical protein